MSLGESNLLIELGPAKLNCLQRGRTYAVLGDFSEFNETTLKGTLNNHQLTRKDYALVQDDLLQDDCTVLDTLMFAANLKYPCSLSVQQKRKAVEALCYKLDLTPSDKIKDIHNRKHVMLAQELLTNPELLVLQLEKGDRELLAVVRDLVNTELKTALVSLEPSCGHFLEYMDSVIVVGKGTIIWQGTVSGNVILI
ncbi:hypothetical protein HDV04_000607 [Boothiomyces sp. JEL0838]|nr:hypothetical protein HDV04_000607 [Boothiomyces sp. JEL0838]